MTTNSDIITNSDIEKAIEEYRQRVILASCPMCARGEPIDPVTGLHPKYQSCYANTIRKVKYKIEKAEDEIVQ